MLQWRIGLFFGAASLAGAFGGALVFGIGFMSQIGGLLGWSWIFILVRNLEAHSPDFLLTPSNTGRHCYRTRGLGRFLRFVLQSLWPGMHISLGDASFG